MLFLEIRGNFDSSKSLPCWQLNCRSKDTVVKTAGGGLIGVYGEMAGTCKRKAERFYIASCMVLSHLRYSSRAFATIPISVIIILTFFK